MSKLLSKRQEELLSLITDYIKDNGISPTVRELAEGIGHSSTSTTHSMLNKLKSKGYISNINGSPRSLRIIKKD